MEIPWGEMAIVALTSSAFTTGMLAMLLFAGKSLIERWLERSLEKFKVDLQLAASERQTRFAKLHEKRAEVIAELYKRLVQIHHSLDYLTADVGEIDRCKWSEKAETTDKLLSAFWEYFEEHRIYFSENLYSKIQELQSESELVLGTLYWADGLLDDAPYEGFQEEFHQEGKDAYVGLWYKILPIRREIEREFRKMLGVDQTNDDVQ